MTLVFVVCGLFGASCTKDNAQPDAYTKRPGNGSVNAASTVPPQPPAATTAPPSSECSQHHN